MAPSKLATGSDSSPTAWPRVGKRSAELHRGRTHELSGVVAPRWSRQSPTQIYSDVATTTFLAVIALWIGGLVSYLVLRAVSARVLGSMKPSWRLPWPGWSRAR